MTYGVNFHNFYLKYFFFLISKLSIAYLANCSPGLLFSLFLLLGDVAGYGEVSYPRETVFVLYNSTGFSQRHYLNKGSNSFKGNLLLFPLI